MTISRQTGIHILVAIAGVWAAVSMAFGVHGALTISDDLKNILSCVKDFWQGKDVYLTWVTFQKEGGIHPMAEPNYLPSLYVFLGPLLWLDWTVIKALTTIANILCSGLLILLLQRLYLPRLSRWQLLLLIFAFLASTPFRSLMLHGQTGVFAMTAFFASLYYLQQNRRILSLVMLVLGVTKYSVGVPLSQVFARKGRWRIFLSAALIQILLLAGGAFWIGSDPITIFRQAIESNAHLRHQGYMNYSNIFLVFGEEGAEFGVMLSAVLVAAAILIAFLRKHEDDFLCITLYAMTSILCLYHGTYDMVMYAIPLTYVLHLAQSWRSRDWLERGVALLLGFSTTLVLWGVEIIETLIGHLYARRSVGLAQFDGVHVAEVWYLLMPAVTLALIGLFALAWRSSVWR